MPTFSVVFVASCSKNLRLWHAIGVDDLRFVRHIRGSAEKPLQVGDIAAIVFVDDGPGDIAKPPDQRKS